MYIVACDNPQVVYRWVQSPSSLGTPSHPADGSNGSNQDQVRVQAAYSTGHKQYPLVRLRCCPVTGLSTDRGGGRVQKCQSARVESWTHTHRRSYPYITSTSLISRQVRSQDEWCLSSSSKEGSVHDSQHLIHSSQYPSGENYELRADLNSEYKDKRKDAIKRVIANMTVGKDVSGLFPDVLKNMQTDDLEQKKLVYLYLMNYAKTQPELVILAVNTFVKVRVISIRESMASTS